MQIEQYRIIAFAPNYAVSNLGNLKNIKKNKVLRQTLSTKGYKRVGLKIGNKRIFYYVHRLVALSFLDNKLLYDQVNHINGIKTDNLLSNLEWCSNQQNMKHAIETGLFNNKGEKHHNTQLTDEQVLEIKILLQKKIAKSKHIAQLYKVSIKCISKIKRGETWKHIAI
jgi:hypothetical protein